MDIDEKGKQVQGQKFHYKKEGRTPVFNRFDSLTLQSKKTTTTNTFERFSQLMLLKKSFKKRWLAGLPEPIQTQIISTAKGQFYADLFYMQNFVKEQDAATGFTVTQYCGNEQQNQREFPPILLAKIDYEEYYLQPMVSDVFYAGMILLLKINGNNVPDFFGPKAQGIIQSYAMHSQESFLHIISELPKFTAEHGYEPATHNIYLSRREPRWLYYSEPYAQEETDPGVFTYYSVDVRNMGLWDLLGQTKLIKIWTMKGIKKSIKVFSSFPGALYENEKPLES